MFKLGGAILDRYLDVSDEDNGHDNVGRLPSAETHLRIMVSFSCLQLVQFCHLSGMLNFRSVYNWLWHV